MLFCFWLWREEPYATTVTFLLLLIKGILLYKQAKHRGTLGYAHPYIPVCTPLKGKMHTPDRKGVHRYDRSNEGKLHCINDMTATEKHLR